MSTTSSVQPAGTAPARTGFCGPENLAAPWQSLVLEVVAAVRKAGRQVVVGDAPRGLDAFVHTAAPGAEVYPTQLWSHAHHVCGDSVEVDIGGLPHFVQAIDFLRALMDQRSAVAHQVTQRADPCRWNEAGAEQAMAQ